MLQSDAILVKILYYELWWDLQGGDLTLLTDKYQRNINQPSHLVSIHLILHSFSFYTGAG